MRDRESAELNKEDDIKLSFSSISGYNRWSDKLERQLGLHIKKSKPKVNFSGYGPTATKIYHAKDLTSKS